MNRISMLYRTGLALIGVAVMAPAHAAWTLNMNKGVTDMTAELFNLHMMIFWVCVVIGIGVFGAMLYSVIVHRKSRGHDAAHFHESTVIELAWTVIPFLILIAVAVPTAGTLLKVEDSTQPDMSIRVTGHQWLWEYNYIDQPAHFYSRLDARSNRARQPGSDIDPSDVEHYLRNVDNPMVVPVHKKVRLLLTSGDVIHSWWVPDLAGKKDAIPGYINDMWFKAEKTGTYRGQCTELCGRGHAFMPIVVKVVSQKKYNNWLARQGGGAQTQNKPAETREPSVSAAARDDEKGNAMNRHRSDNGSGAAPPTAGDDNASQSNGDTKKTANAQAAGGAQADTGGQTSGSGQMTKQALMSQGKKVYGNICTACHQPDGKGLPAAGYPSLVDSQVVTGPIKDHIAQILNGKNAMPPYRGSLSDKQIAGVVTYERNSFGNNTGDVVQPAQVAKQR